LAVPTPYFSLRYLSVYLALAAVITGGLLAWTLYHLTRGWLSSQLVRVVLASFVVLMPALGKESTATITNTVWMFLSVLPWALISLEESRRDTVLRSALAFLGATASALSLVFIPLGLGWLAYRRRRPVLIVMVSYAAGVAVQLAVALATPKADTAPNSLSALRDGIGARVFGTFLVGTRWETAWWSANWRSLVVLAPLVTVVLLVGLGLGAGRRSQVMAGVFTVLAVVFFAVPAWGRGTSVLELAEGHGDGWIESRFSVVPVLLLASAFALVLAPADAPAGRQTRRIGRAVFAGWAAVLIAACFSQSTYRGTDPTWTSRVDHVLASKCAGRPGSTMVTVPNLVAQAPPLPKLPNGYYPLTVRCSNLE
jgi:hypothetical protein